MVSSEPPTIRSDEDLEVTYLREQVQACFRLITTLEKEKQDLQHQTKLLEAQVASYVREKEMVRDVSQPENIAHEDKEKSCSEAKTIHVHMEVITRMPNGEAKLPPELVESDHVMENGKDGERMMPSKLPPPPPPPLKMLPVKSKAVRRMPEVIEFYRSLTRKDSRIESRSNGSSISEASFSKNMIGEIENRSTYLMAIKSDVETQAEFINFLIREVTAAAYTKISDVEAFVKWLDGELASLVDERAVLRHFPQWPERKADTLREAACTFRDLKNLECEILSYKDNLQQTSSQAFSRMQALQHRLELRVGDIERTKESSVKKYKEMHVPWEWMQDMVTQLKLSSMELAKHYMARTLKELKLKQGKNENEMLLQGVRFAYRVHQDSQFAGGFDVDTTKVFEELRQFPTRPC
ncbi:unnamed protein product [Rhodiola kirilowii]